ncbi:hypothetical protein TNCT_35921 [Trichonephila clavata]|uniref:Uncharacterized protein n=1 Tax=Trichonephila clavata TaxID=2740835 RepID=A0A8X6LGW0_TRICU|nr:hypothetical protein TNCT_35921 [Trichonephila clavata]
MHENILFHNVTISTFNTRRESITLNCCLFFFSFFRLRDPHTADDSHKEAPPRRVETSSVAIILSNRNAKPRFSDATCAWISQFVRNFSNALIYNRFFSYISREGGENPLGDFRCQRRYLCGGDGECLESLH